jgi:hypothetical protein
MCALRAARLRVSTIDVLTIPASTLKTELAIGMAKNGEVTDEFVNIEPHS